MIIILIFIILGFNYSSCRAAEITKDSVYEYAKSIGVKYPEICAAQAIHETGDFTSYGCRNRHNLFGFGGRGYYKQFCDWQESVRYYKSWQDNIRKSCRCNRSRWFHYISHHFAEDRLYARKLRGVIRRSRFTYQYPNVQVINPLLIHQL